MSKVEGTITTMKKWNLSIVFGTLILAAAFVSCSDDKEDAAALCVKTCEKSVECSPEAKAFLGICKEICKNPMTGGDGEKCTNEAAIIAKSKECLSVACPQYEACGEKIPACIRASTGGTGGVSGAGGALGTAGSRGTGGTSGAGGSSGTVTGCAVGAKADACCAALQAKSPQAPAEGCEFAASCQMLQANPENQSQFGQVCNTFLMLSAGVPDVPACK